MITKIFECFFKYSFLKFLTMTRWLGWRMALHSALRPFSCGRCQKIFKLKNALKKHAATHFKALFSYGLCEKFRKCVLPLNIWKGIWEFTQEKSLTLVIFAVSVSAMGILWKITDKEHTIESQIPNLILRIALHWFKEIKCKSNVYQPPLRYFPKYG